MARRPLPGQLQLPLPLTSDERERVAMTDSDVERAYAELMGSEALERQRAAAARAEACTCGRDGQPAARHAPGCPAIPLKGTRR
jgi:hypothetical protein